MTETELTKTNYSCSQNIQCHFLTNGEAEISFLGFPILFCLIEVPLVYDFLPLFKSEDFIFTIQCSTVKINHSNFQSLSNLTCAAILEHTTHILSTDNKFHANLIHI